MSPSKIFPQQKRRRQDNSDDVSSDSDAEVRKESGHWAAWLLMEGTDASRPLSALSPFAVQKGFSGIAGQLKTIKRLRNGTFLVECLTGLQSKKLLKTTKFVDRDVKVSPHRNLNSSKGVIRCADLRGVPDAEIKEELKSQGVVEVRRAMFRKGGDLVPTNTFFLTFCTPTLPQSVKVGYLNVRVTLYVPSPLRCFKCQKFGHVRDRCPGEEVCGTCAQAVHEGPCTNPAQCVNCKGDHASSSRNCPIWKTEETIQRVKTENKISFFEARKIVQSSQPAKSYSQAVNNNPDPEKPVKKRTFATQSTQTEISCFTSDIPGLKVEFTPVSKKVQTTDEPRQRSPAPSPSQNETSETMKERPSEGSASVTNSRKVPVGPSSKGVPGGGKGSAPVVVESFQPPSKLPVKGTPTGIQPSRPGGSGGRSRKGLFSQMKNRFSPLQSKEGESESAESMGD